MALSSAQQRALAAMNASNAETNKIELTDFQALVLATVISNSANKTVVAIIQGLLDDTRVVYNHAQVYKALTRLLDLELITAHTGKSEPGHKGSPPQTYAITDQGIDLLKQKVAAYQNHIVYIEAKLTIAQNQARRVSGR